MDYTPDNEARDSKRAELIADFRNLRGEELSGAR